ncbi:hypothetical protein, partial [Parasutterella sp.]|uniref:hypothetical protein n=1 Tax=Parasutterella sp. TaxID=2049037 RepID=UPI003AB5F0DA
CGYQKFLSGNWPLILSLNKNGGTTPPIGSYTLPILKLTDFTTLNSFCSSFYKLETHHEASPAQSSRELNSPPHFANLDTETSYLFGI